MYQITMHISEAEYSLRNLYLSREERNSLAIIKIIEANRVVDDMFLARKINLNVYGMLTQVKDNLKNYEKIVDKYTDPNIQRDEMLEREAVLQDINKLLVSIKYTVDNDLEKHQNNINIVLGYHKMFIMGLPIIVIAFLILVLIFIFNKIVTPINSIILAMQKVVEGEYKEITDTDGLFEIRKLVEFYNKLIDHVKLLLEKEIFDKNEIKKQEMAIEVIHEKLEKRISEFLEILNYASHGDLTLKAQIQDSDEIARLGEAFNRMLLNLSLLIRQVKSTSIEFSKSATEIVITTEDMTRGASEQSSQISKVSAALEELSIVAGQISENTLVVLDSTKNALCSVQEGKNLMNKTITSIQQMRKIAESTARRILELGNKIQKIEEIAKIINEISEQTNLLALNAAIEATKAGEHGKGFAIVADEVGKLAENSSHSASEIKNLIRDIQIATNATVLSMEEETKSSEIGEKYALLTGKTFESIEYTIQDSTIKTKEIALATQQQKIGSEQATKAMENILDISHRGAVGTIQILDSARKLHELANSLNNLISKFKI